MDVDTLVWFCIVIAFFISFAIGANDAANALGTSYGSNALPLMWLLVLGATFEFIGACFLSSGLADKLALSIIPELTTYPAQLQEQMMLSASIASAAFIFFSVAFAVPISGTHTIIGALIGAGLVGSGASSVNWVKLGLIVASWFISPLLSIMLTFMLFSFVCWAILSPNKSDNFKLVSITQLAGISCIIISIMIAFLLPEHEGDGANWELFAIMIPTVYFFGVFALKTFLIVYSRRGIHNKEKSTCCFTCEEFCEVLCFWQNKLILENI